MFPPTARASHFGVPVFWNSPQPHGPTKGASPVASGAVLTTVRVPQTLETHFDRRSMSAPAKTGCGFLPSTNQGAKSLHILSWRLPERPHSSGDSLVRIHAQRVAFVKKSRPSLHGSCKGSSKSQPFGRPEDRDLPSRLISGHWLAGPRPRVPKLGGIPR